MTVRKIHKIKNSKLFIENIQLLMKHVRNKQKKLAKWVTIYGPRSRKVVKKQLLFMRSWEFRVIAVYLTSKYLKSNTTFSNKKKKFFLSSLKTAKFLIKKLRNFENYKTWSFYEIHLPEKINKKKIKSIKIRVRS